MAINKFPFSVITILILVLITSNNAFSAWQGPYEVVSGPWGSDEQSFGIEYGDTSVTIPGSLCISNDVSIYVSDSINTRVKVYSSLGTLQSIIKPINIKNERFWPEQDMVCDTNGNVYTLNYDNKIQKYSKSGQLLWEKDNLSVGKIFALPDNNIILAGSKKGQNALYIKYSASGKFINSYFTRPIELGVASLSNENVTVTYPDIVYKLKTNARPYKFFRDIKNYVYLLEKYLSEEITDKNISYRIHKYNICGNEVALFNLPQSQYEPIPPEGFESPTWSLVPIIEYGEPIVSNVGDIYSRARTKTLYKILKWTWQDDPNTPSCPDVKIKQAACDNTCFMKADMRLTAADLAGKSKEDLRLMRNEIYSRHGKTFQSADLQKYFSGKCWYKADPGYSDTMLTPVDRENIRIVQEGEKGK